MDNHIICRVLTGPTASGKTGLSLKLAKEFGYEILCMDSMQIYRRMDIGTAKPTVSEQKMVKHHLLDVVEPDASFSVSAYRKLAEEKILELHQQGKQVLFVGGTGLYLNALMHPMAMGNVSADETLREELRKLTYNQTDRLKLHEKLEELDPVTAARLPVNDVRRVIRAIEVSTLTGIPFSQQPDRSEESPFIWKVAALNMERSTLYRRIEQRVDEMLENGLEEEVRKLLEEGIPENAQSMSGLGYKEMIPFIHGVYDRARAAYEIKLGTRHYAKRQITFLKREEKIIYFDPNDPQSYDGIRRALV